MSILIEGMEMPKTGLYFVSVDNSNGRDKTIMTVGHMPGNHNARQIVGSFELVAAPSHGRLIDADTLTEQMECNLWAIEDKAEKELGFDETLRRGMQYGHAVCLDAVNDAAVIFVPQIVHCCECEYNNHCLTQEFVEDASKIPFDKNTWFCADAKKETN